MSGAAPQVTTPENRLPLEPPAPRSEMDALLLGRTRELIAAGPDQKNWRGIGIALLVIIVVCALIVTAIILLTPGDKGFNVKKSRISLDEIMKGYYNYKRFNGTWISDHEFIYQDGFGAIGIYDVTNNTEQIIMSNTTFRQYIVSQYSLSPDRQYLLLAHKYQQIFRYTYTAAFLLYNISSEYLEELFPASPGLVLQYAAWGNTGNQLVYILDNNIYYLSDVGAKPRQLTSNGKSDELFNGIPDWVYEEEVLYSSNAVWWSPDGTKLCYASFNDSNVEKLQYPYYGSYTDPNNVYPKIKTLRYPKAGRNNPNVSLWVVDLTSEKLPIEVSPPNDYKGLDYYFTKTQWMDNDALSVIWLKRSQNTSTISFCKENDRWNCIKNLQEDSYGNGWVSIQDQLIFSTDKNYYFLHLSGPNIQNAGRFQHVTAVNVRSGTKDFLTQGKYDVTSVLAYNSEEKTVYYLSTLEGKPGERHLFSVTDLTHTHPRMANCITCKLGPDCLYNDVRFSMNASYYILECLGPGIPKVELWSTKDKKLLSTLETNYELGLLIDRRAMPKVKNLQVPINEYSNANVRLLLPPVLQEYEITKYPMLVEVYGGPGSQTVSEKFSIGWGHYLASKKNIIYTRIDGRGSGYQGDNMLHALYKKLGTVEVADQIGVTNHLKQQFSFIDGKKVAIFGWSYGGYVAALSLAESDMAFNCGISVAPVTSWLYYDSVYTERYMQNPNDKVNMMSYESSDVMKRAGNFKGKKYILIHGTADDNVHWQQSMMLAKALTDAGVIFRMQVYPDERHALGSVKQHLYQTMADFLDYCYSDNNKEDSAYFQPVDNDR